MPTRSNMDPKSSDCKADVDPKSRMWIDGQVETQLSLELCKRLEKTYEMLNELDEDGMG